MASGFLDLADSLGSLNSTVLGSLVIPLTRLRQSPELPNLARDLGASRLSNVLKELGV